MSKVYDQNFHWGRSGGWRGGNFYNIKTIGYLGPDPRGLTRTQTYSIGLCTIESSLVKFAGSPTARIYCQLKESLNMLKTLEYFTKVFSSWS